MKEGMKELTAFQVASLRIIFSGLVLLPIAFRYFKKVEGGKIWLVFLSGVLGSLLPAYLFCIAEEKIDSSLAGVLNSLTPIFVIIVGALFFSVSTSGAKVLGIIIAFSGSVLLFLSQPGFEKDNNLFHIMLVVIATIMYGVNVNMVSKYLKGMPSLQIASVALTLNSIPALAVLYFTGFFEMDLGKQEILASVGYSAILGIFGTAIASILFYQLIKRAGAVFSSLVTYGIPVVAIFWGIIYGESVGPSQFASMLLILAGVYVANMKTRAVSGSRETRLKYQGRENR